MADLPSGGAAGRAADAVEFSIGEPFDIRGRH